MRRVDMFLRNGRAFPKTKSVNSNRQEIKILGNVSVRGYMVFQPSKG